MSGPVRMSRWQSTARASSKATLDRSKSVLQLLNLSGDRVAERAFPVELFLQLDNHFSLVLKFALVSSKSIPEGVERVYI